MTRGTSTTVALVVLTVALAAPWRASVSAGQFWGNWGDWFGKPHGGNICYGADGSIVACPGTETPPRGGNPEQPPDDESWMEKPRDKDDSFCNACHVNRTTEVAGPKMLSSSVLGDPPRFWRRHSEIATRIKNKRVLTSVRNTQSLSPTLQKLMAARPRR